MEAFFVYRFLKRGEQMIQEVLGQASGEHYLAIMLIIVLSGILRGRSVPLGRVRQRSFWLTIAVCLLLVLQDVLEKYTQLDPARRTMRVILSITGYSLRPAAVLGFLLVIWPLDKKVWYLWVPVILNAVLYSTALVYPDLTFGYHEDYHFYRGPLGRTMFVLCVLYMIQILYMIRVRFRDHRGTMFVNYLCAAGCIGSMIVDVNTDGVTILSAVLISSMTFYLFLRTQGTDHDPLTQLWNRLVFYEDCNTRKNQINGVASIDMNGLKLMNDEQGHDAGDRALEAIGESLKRVMNRKISAYRIGGDEFMLLFYRCSREEMLQALDTLDRDVQAAGLSVAVGLAEATEAKEPIDELIRTSDQRMYQSKSEYYQVHDRRGQR